jgi:hypothetical protein
MGTLVSVEFHAGFSGLGPRKIAAMMRIRGNVKRRNLLDINQNYC